ncbi:MAG: hypothetical protein A3B10_01550 [Candidatus Doudnabacteria bacterium RIFCSPLOWO2_01_FULL_44_21]|uniref:Uncharacterized protein n=1 Tax=Candidatus Doudnabacteria bacterium RIFCSPLOWO2_01_FULL_44_21 TaxID=1817841 RepID=A0A1F5PX82_9BACT|nr:MAG: hypothetical protein A3B95_04455 [Candidatus Doudnabacteria bacterium RIFCSPHIGHO2_02_FULL_43_13b]OGE94467.1 MAG: hypothetical protein A3B10_01550 [Candidatus Doudnabacteria bacterium RIFCSPLOWO2_01_FULL_44_21]
MLFRRKIRNKIILVGLIVFLFIYWRGTKAYTKQNNLECERHIVYAVCKQLGKSTTVPTLWDVLKAGVRF